MTSINCPPPESDNSLPEEWCSADKIKDFGNIVSSSQHLLHPAGLLRPTCEFWIKYEICQTWDTQNVFQPEIFEINIDSSDKTELDLITQKCLLWSEFHWSNKLETLYLSNKSDLDRVTCRLLRVG